MPFTPPSPDTLVEEQEFTPPSPESLIEEKEFVPPSPDSFVADGEIPSEKESKAWDAWTGEISPELKATAPWLFPPKPTAPPRSLAPVTAEAVSAIIPEGKPLLPGTPLPETPPVAPVQPTYPSGFPGGLAGEMTDQELEKNVKAALDQYSQQTLKITERNPILEALHFTPDQMPSGEDISRAFGIPKAIGMPISTAEKLLAGFVGFLGSTSGASQAALAEIAPLKPLLFAKWSHDIAASGGEQAANFWESLKRGDMQGAMDSGGTVVADALMLFGGKVPGVNRIPGLVETGVRSVPKAVKAIRPKITPEVSPTAEPAPVRVQQSIAKELGVEDVGTSMGRDHYQFPTGKTDAGMEMDRVQVPAGSSIDVVRAAIETRKAQVSKDFSKEETASPMDFTPSLRTKEGKIIEGTPGGVHDDIYKAQGPIAGAELTLEEPEHGFLYKGEFKSREQAAKLLGETEPLRSERLNELRKQHLAKKLPAAPTPVGPAPSPVAQEPALVGQGPGAMTGRPSDHPQPAETVEGTGLKHAIDELERVSYGFAERTIPEKQAMASAWNRAGEAIARDPEAGRKITQALVDNPRRGLTGDESALILRHKVTLENAINDAAERTLTTTGDAKVQANAELTRYRAELNDLLDAVAARGSEWGREGRWRRALAYEDYSFAAQERLLSAAKGRPLTEAERISLQEQLAEYKRKLDALEKHNAEKEQKSIDIGVDKAVNKAQKTARTGRRKSGEMTPQEEVADLTVKIGNKIAEKDFSSAGSLVQRLMRAFVEQGVRGRDNLVNSVHGVLKTIVPDITVSETKQAMSGYGDYKLLPKDEVSILVRGYKGELQQILKLEDMAAGRAPRKTGIERRTPTEEERALIKQVEAAKKKGGYTVTDPETQLRTAMNAVKRRLENQIADLERQISTRERIVKEPTRLEYDAEANRLKARRDELKKQFDEIFPKRPMTEAERLQLWKDRTTRRISELQDMLRSGDVEIKPRKPPVELDLQGRRLKAELDKTKEDIKHAREKAEWQKMSVFQKAKRGTIDAYDAARMLMTTGEFSFILRQGKWTALSRPLTTLKALPAMFRAMRNWRTAHEADLAILEHPEYPAAKKAKLHIVDESASLTRQEEIYAGRWAHALPGVSHFNRAARVFLNKIRFDTWQAMRKSLSRNGEPTPAEDAAIARFVNESTGRGELGFAEQAAVPLGRAFFAPRYTISRFQLLAGHPLWKGSARSRAVIAKEYARSLIGLGLYYSLLNAYFSNSPGYIGVTLDPRSADFGKVRIGNTRLDPLAGLAQAATFIGRTVTGETKSQKGKVIAIRKKEGEKPRYGDPTWTDVAARFARSKMHPVPGALANLFSGTTMDGRETSFIKETGNLVGPITYYDIYAALDEQDIPDSVAMSLLAVLGEGLQTYQPRKK